MDPLARAAAILAMAAFLLFIPQRDEATTLIKTVVLVVWVIIVLSFGHQQPWTDVGVWG